MRRILACLLVLILTLSFLASCNTDDDVTVEYLPDENEAPKNPTATSGSITNGSSANKDELDKGEENGEKPEDSEVEFFFSSLWGNECAVTAVNVGENFSGTTITIPEKSPDGKTVVECRINCFANNVPTHMTKEDFESEILSQADALTDTEKRLLDSYYLIVDLEAFLDKVEDPELKEDKKDIFLSKYPFAEVGVFYVFTGVIRKEYFEISKILDKLNYTYEDNLENKNKIEKLCSFVLDDISNLGNIEEIIFPETLKVLSIRGAEHLKTIIIPDSVESIKNFAFCDCMELTSVSIPKGVTKIEEGVFEYCENLTTISFRGTVEEWGNIFKYDEWDKGSGDYVIECTDGNIVKIALN